MHLCMYIHYIHHNYCTEMCLLYIPTFFGRGDKFTNSSLNHKSDQITPLIGCNRYIHGIPISFFFFEELKCRNLKLKYAPH